MVEVAVALIGAWAVVTGPVLLLVVNRRLSSHGATLEEVREQVSNDHDTNLRNDVDDLAEAVERLEAAFGTAGTMLGGLRREVRKALSEQRDHSAASALVVSALEEADRRLWAEIRRHHPIE
jgi:HAMP domain-containing protein